MAIRKFPLVTGEIYHVYNRSVARQQIFLTAQHYQRMADLIGFYIYSKPPLRFSYYKRLPQEQKETNLVKLKKDHKKLVEIYMHCLMPNHFHFLLKQTQDQGISKFLGTLQNSYARFLNTKHKRSGAVFQEMFKAVRIETDEQLLHSARYILLNAYTGYVVKQLSELETYPWSSFPEYMGERQSFVYTDLLLSFFSSADGFKQFVFDQSNYQRTLDKIKHLILE